MWTALFTVVFVIFFALCLTAIVKDSVPPDA
jgi:hypothetical protein